MRGRRSGIDDELVNALADETGAGNGPIRGKDNSVNVGGYAGINPGGVRGIDDQGRHLRDALEHGLPALTCIRTAVNTPPVANIKLRRIARIHGKGIDYVVGEPGITRAPGGTTITAQENPTGIKISRRDGKPKSLLRAG